MAYRSNSENNARVYIGNLPHDIRSQEVEDLFHKYGKIVDCEIKLPKSGEGPAFAFLEFEDTRDAADAIRGRDGYRMAGQKIRVQLPQSRDRQNSGGFSGGYGGYRGSSRGQFSGRGRGRGGGPPRRSDYRVMISGLPGSGSWQDIKDHMREAGEVVYADVFRDGAGVVEFLHKSDMEWAAKNLDDSKFKSHEGETAFIRVKCDSGITKLRSRSRSPRGKSRSKSRSRSRSRSSSRSRSRSRTPKR